MYYSTLYLHGGCIGDDDWQFGYEHSGDESADSGKGVSRCACSGKGGCIKGVREFWSFTPWNAWDSSMLIAAITVR